MPSRSASILAAVALVLASCSLQEPARLDDPALLDRIGVETPSDIVWTRTVAGITVAGTTPSARSAELAVLEDALDELPAALLEAADVRTIYRIAATSEEELEPTTLAFARGPDLYVLDVTFDGPTGDGVGPMEMARVLSHELAHVAQFRRLTTDDAELILESTTDIDPLQLAESTRDFATATGWRDGGASPLRPSWVLADRSGTTSYGTTDPEEDLAESVSLVAMGRAGQLSPDRVEWVEGWLDLDADTAAAGKPYVPRDAVATTSETALYDQRQVASFATRSLEPLYFVLPPRDLSTVADEITTGLSQRGVAGTMATITSSSVPRLGGRFARPDGTAYWVELWDFRGSGIAGAPDGLVLTYVVLW